MVRVRKATVLLLAMLALSCSTPSRSFGEGLEYRRVRLVESECVDCAKIDLSAFTHFGPQESVEKAVAFRLSKSEMLRIRLWRQTHGGETAWCARVLLTESGAQRARDFAIDPSADPLEDTLAVSIDGVVVDLVLRGELRASPSMGCFGSAEAAQRTIRTLGSIPFDDDL